MNSFWANTEKNTKEECKVIFTGSQRRENARRRVERMQGNEKLKRKILEERNRHKEKRGKE